jgi:hypothetical protein
MFVENKCKLLSVACIDHIANHHYQQQQLNCISAQLISTSHAAQVIILTERRADAEKEENVAFVNPKR